MSDNIIQIDTLRIDRHKPRKCTCDPYDRTFTVDTVNKEITCGCGMVVDPFEAMVHVTEHYERINDQHKSLNEQRKQWMKERPHSVVFKKLEQNYRHGKMLPSCPKCEQMFDFKEISWWSNAEFYRKLEQTMKGEEQK